jgi:predicted double-glycine peptidase
MVSILLDFPSVRQSRDYTCGVAAFQAILEYYGISFREDQLEKLLGTTETDGTRPDQIVKLARHLGLQVIEMELMKIEDLAQCLRYGFPILVVFQSWCQKDCCQYAENDNNGHYAVIIGIDHQMIIFEDPSLVTRGYLPINQFIKRWHDRDAYGRHYRQYGIVFCGKPPAFRSDVAQLIR